MLAVTEGKQLLRKAKTIVEKIHQTQEKQERDNTAAGIRTEEYEDKVWRISLLAICVASYDSYDYIFTMLLLLH
jgi:hypothetical protein